MNTLIIPCAGKSNRFPNMKPKWLLTHPDGELMIEKSIKGLNTEIFDRIIITIVKPHDDKYEAKLILEQVFKDNPNVEICLLDDFTSSASETVYSTLTKMNVKGSFVIKDSDNSVSVKLSNKIENSITYYDLHKHSNINNIPAKSFLIVNEQGIVSDIIEKSIVSNLICLGVYAFDDTETFINGYLHLTKKNIKGEMYISHVISYLLSTNKYIFTAIEANNYEDWGTLKEWQNVQRNYRTYFVDVDGVLMENCGKYGSNNWSNNKEIIYENMETIRKLQNRGAQIVITTSRKEEYRKDLENILLSNGIKPYEIIMGLNHSARVLINDFAPTNPYPSGIAISFPRNCLIKDYLE